MHSSGCRFAFFGVPCDDPACLEKFQAFSHFIDDSSRVGPLHLSLITLAPGYYHPIQRYNHQVSVTSGNLIWCCQSHSEEIRHVEIFVTLVVQSLKSLGCLGRAGHLYPVFHLYPARTIRTSKGGNRWCSLSRHIVLLLAGKPLPDG